MLDPKTKRGDVPEEFTWNLADIFESDESWRAEYEALRAMPDTLAAYHGRLGESAETLLAYFRLNDELDVRVSKLYGYASCKADQDQGDAAYQDMRGKAMNVAVALSSAGAFAAPEIMALSDETLERFAREEPGLAEYRRSLYRVRRMREHILSPAEEKLLAAAGEISDAPEQVMSVFSNADLTFPDVRTPRANITR